MRGDGGGPLQWLAFGPRPLYHTQRIGPGADKPYDKRTFV